MTAKSTTPAALTWSGVTARRMARHALAEPATDLSPAGIAGVLCGAHAQVLSAAELSIGRRIAGATRADVQRALWEERALVKTFGPRGTIHLLPTADLPMWTGALSALPSSVPTHPDRQDAHERRGACPRRRPRRGRPRRSVVPAQRS